MQGVAGQPQGRADLLGRRRQGAREQLRVLLRLRVEDANEAVTGVFRYPVLHVDLKRNQMPLEKKLLITDYKKEKHTHTHMK